MKTQWKGPWRVWDAIQKLGDYGKASIKEVFERSVSEDTERTTMWVFHLASILCVTAVAMLSQAARARNLIRWIKIVNLYCREYLDLWKQFNHPISPNTEKCRSILQLLSIFCLSKEITPSPEEKFSASVDHSHYLKLTYIFFLEESFILKLLSLSLKRKTFKLRLPRVFIGLSDKVVLVLTELKNWHIS